ncbi:hypothetical protein BDK51DRAFT_27247 [Blyttiomyces helicus]|uniref:Uncharacterized protein n=1 Tax=Blyttiomyces helicus TaxID=388810 RepID=A0A4P9WJR9_9FUNG|nr:hypothetical protein BDK51DRAFT_27247 [Blyttiomyces helicus]|eukprot:RKO92315.1 hypothetical protein BDK51DRAFT_27247 [Blyttiomyces helicus]
MTAPVPPPVIQQLAARRDDQGRQLAIVVRQQATIIEQNCCCRAGNDNVITDHIKEQLWAPFKYYMSIEDRIANVVMELNKLDAGKTIYLLVRAQRGRASLLCIHRGGNLEGGSNQTSASQPLPETASSTPVDVAAQSDPSYVPADTGPRDASRVELGSSDELSPLPYLAAGPASLSYLPFTRLNLPASGVRTKKIRSLLLGDGACGITCL